MKCFHYVIKAKKAIFRAFRKRHTVDFHLWSILGMGGCGYNLRHCLQTMCTLDTERRLPLVDICATWRADQVLYCSCTLSIYNDNIVLYIFTQDSRSWWRSGIEEFNAVQSTYQTLCTAVNALAIYIHKEKCPKQCKLYKGLHVGLMRTRYGWAYACFAQSMSGFGLF